MFNDRSRPVARFHSAGIQIANPFKHGVQIGARHIKPDPSIGLFGNGCGIAERRFQMASDIFMCGKWGFNHPLVGAQPQGDIRGAAGAGQGDVQGICGFRYISFTALAGGEGCQGDAGIFADGDGTDGIGLRGGLAQGRKRFEAVIRHEGVPPRGL